MARPDRDFAQTHAARLFALGDVQAAPFFGGASLRFDGVQFAMAFNGVLFLRVGEGNRETLVAAGGAPFHYRGETRSVEVATYLSVAPLLLEDTDAFAEVAEAAVAAARVNAASKAPRPRRFRR